ncbi:hypothetical protein BGX23_012230 [Mortierella sp. AD031]|nr:hypothetical protein BGX23_012230 [Mortierella sp. AD031]
MRLARTTGLAAITAKEFAQWITPFESPTATATATALQQRRQKNSALFTDSPTLDGGHGNKDNAADRNVGIAVSGGVDSMALATLLARHYSLQDRGDSASDSDGGCKRTTRLHAFIVDHKLRDNSTEEANYVAQQVQKLNVVPHVLTLDWSTPDSLDLDHHHNKGEQLNSTNDVSQKPDRIHLETKARLRRYKAIAQKCHALSIENLFVGHHAGDQVETTLFRFSRASGIDGLAGIQSLAPLGVLAVPEALDIRVVRPLLQVSKDRLRATCEEAGTLWVEDPSNRSLDYQRNVIRQYQEHQDSLVVVTPWIKDIWFDSANGACHLKLESNSNIMAGAEPKSESKGLATGVEWLQNSQNHVVTRLLSFLVRWVNCKDHNPRLEDIQSLQQNLRQQQWQFATSGSSLSSSSFSTTNTAPDFSSTASTSTSPTVYRRLKQRASKRSADTQESFPAQQQQGPAPGVIPPFTRTPITLAGVMFSPPRKTKGVPDHWTISRQPMSHADQISATVSAPYDNRSLDILWDQRFFLRIGSQELTTSLAGQSERLQIRPLNAGDVDLIRRRLRSKLEVQGGSQGHGQEEDGLKEFDRWMSTVPGNARYTIPVILSQPHPQENDRDSTGTGLDNILSLPTLDLQFGPTRLSFQSRFKSNPPTGAKDMRSFQQYNNH